MTFPSFRGFQATGCHSWTWRRELHTTRNLGLWVKYSDWMGFMLSLFKSGECEEKWNGYLMTKGVNDGRDLVFINSHVLLSFLTIYQGYTSHLPLHLGLTIWISASSGIWKVSCAIFQAVSMKYFPCTDASLSLFPWASFLKQNLRV